MFFLLFVIFCVLLPCSAKVKQVKFSEAEQASEALVLFYKSSTSLGSKAVSLIERVEEQLRDEIPSLQFLKVDGDDRDSKVVECFYLV
jgi:hypothetical protein